MDGVSTINGFLQLLPTAAYVVDESGFVLSFNRMAADLWGRSPAKNDPDARYVGTSRIFGVDRLPILSSESFVAEALRLGRPGAAVHRMLCFDGTCRTFRSHVGLLRSDAGAIVGAIVTFVDATKDEEEREGLLRENEVSRELDAFAHALTHEVSGPLRSIAGVSRILTNEFGDELGDRGKSLVARIRQSAGRMERLILDFDAYVRLGQEEVALTRANLADAVESARSRFTADLSRTRGQISVLLPLPDVLAVAPLLRLVLDNLLSNSLHFVPQGVAPSVVVRAERRPDAVRIWIEDNGVGIPEEDRRRLFLPFERLDRGDRQAGAGMGLALVRRAVERMGGRCGMEAGAEGKGSRFWFELPPGEASVKEAV